MSDLPELTDPQGPTPSPAAGEGEAWYLKDLNDSQLQAVETLDGPVLVLAGAGTGKTRVLTTRLAHVLVQGRANPLEVLAVTFTNKAAREMKERVAALLGRPVEGWWVGTFHALGARILRSHAEACGLKSNFTILDADDQVRLIKQLLESHDIDEKKWPPRVLSGIIQRWKDRGLTPGKVPEDEASIVAGGAAITLYGEYQERLKRLNAADFGDLLLHCLTVFQDRPEILKKYQNQFRYLLVDEYQDTNVAQYLWLRLLAQAHKNICCVGDDDQSIYSWRGAEVENILEVLLNSDDHSVWCNASFDLGVIARNFPDRLPEIWQALEDGRVHDIIIREKLLHLTTHGSLEFMELPGGVNRKLLYGLAALVAHYLDIDISESKKGNEGWRTNFGELQGLAAKDYPQDAWNYATEDALYPEIIYHLQETRRNEVIAQTGVDPFHVEAFRTACDFALFLWTCWGIRVDAERFVEVRDWLQEELKPENVNLLVASGILRPAVPARPYKNEAKDDSGNLKMTKPINESINTVKMRALITRLADTGKVT
ncbi:MAG: UvrD-helicase domain-containing protein, partial [Proteobacteria bacterium]|nr:UvrD-helicase domain-containing protein [Pseudomonadota bacterium]